MRSRRLPDEAMKYVDQWVARRPELLDDSTRDYFVGRGALPRPDVSLAPLATTSWRHG